MVSFDSNDVGDDDPPPDDNFSSGCLDYLVDEMPLVRVLHPEEKTHLYVSNDGEDFPDSSSYKASLEEIPYENGTEIPDESLNENTPDTDFLTSFMGDYIFEPEDPEIDPFAVEGEDSVKIWDLLSRSLEEKRRSAEIAAYLKYCRYAS